LAFQIEPDRASDHSGRSEGRFPVSTIHAPTGAVHRWHGGVHLQSQGLPIRAIADGTVVAYRFAPAGETYDGLGEYDTSFVLIRHETEAGESTPVVFYSLYMHLANRQALQPDRYAQLPAWMKQAGPSTAVRQSGQKVWRKEVLGFAGKLYDRETCHFEVFTTDEALQAFWRDSLFKTEGCGSDDCFGDTHFVIPAGTQFLARHPRAAQEGPHRIALDAHAHCELPLGQQGSNEGPGDADPTLYVSVRFHKGARIATTYTWDNGRQRYVRLGEPVRQPDHEYELYRLATALYPDVPSAGLEWLRWGRVLGPDRSARQENWQLVRYAGDKVGYVDLAPERIVKLSDADFPHWHGWERRAQGQLVGADDGLCTDEAVIALAQAGDEDSKRKLRHLVCKHPSEWDASDLATRYAALRAPGQPLHEAGNWTLFEQHVNKLAFWAEAGLPQRSVWHFHPLQFIRHFRKCGWLSPEEFAQCFPRALLRLEGAQFQRAQTSWQFAHRKATQWSVAFNKAARKYGISNSRSRMIHLLSHVIPETGGLSFVVELGGSRASYSPYYGRGLIQLTHLENYRAYGRFRAFTRPSDLPASFSELGWDPDTLIARDNAGAHNADNCADSAGFYVAKKAGMLMHLDHGVSQDDAIIASKDVNGYVDIQNLNGLEIRLQSVEFLKTVLLDLPIPSGDIPIQFTWRRNSRKEPVLNEQGEPLMSGSPPRPRMRYFPVRHSILVPMERQKP
jgi:hypothetical protein